MKKKPRKTTSKKSVKAPNSSAVSAQDLAHQPSSAPQKDSEHQQKAPRKTSLFSEMLIAGDEEVTSILERVKQNPKETITVVVPPQAKLFQSLIHLKLLYKEALALHKVITIASSNEAGLTLAANTGFPTELRKDIEIPNKIVKGKSLLATKKALKSTETIDSSTFMMPAPGKRIINLFFGVAALVFIIIAYFVLPTVTISITPEIKVEKPLDRITLADNEKNSAEIALSNGDMVATYPISTEVELTKTYQSTGVSSKGNNASGQLTIHNDGGATQLLIARTRFRSPDGIIFRIQNAVSVPAKGTIDAVVTADPIDEKGQVSGDKGNIDANTRFTLPALKGEYKDLMYGINAQPFTGGTTEEIRIVDTKDTESATKDIVDQLKNIATQKLQERLDQENNSQRKSLAMFNNDKTLKIEILASEIKDGVKASDVKESFQAYGKIRVSTIVFDRRDIMKVLDRKLSSLLSPDLRIASYDLSNMELQFVEQDTRTGKIKVNTTMPYRLEYSFQADFSERIKNQIIGMSLSDTEKYLNSLESIAEAKVQAWPFWVNTIPGLKSNIHIDIISS